MERISVRLGTSEDARGTSRLMDLNSLPRTAVAEGAFLVAESGDEILAAVEYRFGKGRLLLGGLLADPFVEERPLAEALYREARVFARRSGLTEVASSRGCPEHLRLAGYRLRGREWVLNADESSGQVSVGETVSGWRRVLALWGRTPVPFFREVGR